MRFCRLERTVRGDKLLAPFRKQQQTAKKKKMRRIKDRIVHHKIEDPRNRRRFLQATATMLQQSQCSNDESKPGVEESRVIDRWPNQLRSCSRGRIPKSDMPINLRALRYQVERSISRLNLEYRLTPGSILTEHDFRCQLHNNLSALPPLHTTILTQDRKILGTRLHHDLSWYDQNYKLRIRPDITILEPERLIVPVCPPKEVLDPFSGCGYAQRNSKRVPSKEFAFAGEAITIELKFARNGITEAMAKLIRKDFEKMMRLFQILDERDEGETVFSYLVILNRFPQPPWQTPLARFLTENRSSRRHKIVYLWKPTPSRYFGVK